MLEPTNDLASAIMHHCGHGRKAGDETIDLPAREQNDPRGTPRAGHQTARRGTMVEAVRLLTLASPSAPLMDVRRHPAPGTR